MTIHHTTLLVSDLDASKAFYITALAPLTYKVAMEFPSQSSVGYGTSGGKVDFWLKGTGGVKVPEIHLAFSGESEGWLTSFTLLLCESGVPFFCCFSVWGLEEAEKGGKGIILKGIEQIG